MWVLCATGGLRVKVLNLLTFITLFSFSLSTFASLESSTELKEACKLEMTDSQKQDCSLFIGFNLVMLYNPSAPSTNLEICDPNMTSQELAKYFVVFMDANPSLDKSSIETSLPMFFKQEIMCGT